MDKKILITTPLYYVNGEPHLGHAYTTLAADIYARHKRRKGAAAFLLTGTDEHGANIEKVAADAGISPQEWSDAVAAKFRELWTTLGITPDDFIRTTEPRHEKAAQAIFRALRDKGLIEKGEYSGLYCTSCEAYYLESELLDGGLCPVHKKKVEPVKEESYFFKLSKFEDKLLAHFDANPDFLMPKSRAKEIVNFVKQGLKDLSISRTTIKWGIPVPDDDKHVMYVWFEALMNYITAPGYLPEGAAPGFDALWPADVQLVGKEIFRFHAVIWPAMLMGLGLPLPKTVFAHGWWTLEGDKMSKSTGNFITPAEIIDAYGVDGMRFLLFRDVPFGNDGDYSREAIKNRYNADLANNLGNLLSRTANMVGKYEGGKLAAKRRPKGVRLSAAVGKAGPAVDAAMDRLAFGEALEAVFAEVTRLNKAVDEKAPWKLVKEDPGAVTDLLFDIVESLRIVAHWLSPFMPDAATKILECLGGDPAKPDADGNLTIVKGEPLFPRK